MASQKLINKTIETFQPHFTRPMTSEDAEEIIYRWSGFLNIISSHLDGCKDGIR